MEDGYINTYYILTGLDRRWTNMDYHEMYCAGHMIEAAVAYYNVTGKRKLLDVCIRMADHMMSVFGPGKRHWVPGHEEIELALVKLYVTTGEKKYLDFAQWLLDERGHGYGDNGIADRVWNADHCQDAVPVRELTDIGGHAVRAMYLFCGMADVAAFTGDQGYIDALHRLWDDVVLRNMYITGGIGSSRHNEGFTEDYDLPNLDLRFRWYGVVELEDEPVHRRWQVCGHTRALALQRRSGRYFTGWRPLLLRQSA